MKEQASDYLDFPANHHLTPSMDHKTPIEEIIFGVAFMAAFGVLQLPYEETGDYPVPTIFNGAPAAFFHAFLLSLNFAFTGAFVTISLRERHPKIARRSRRLAVDFIVAAVGILVCVVLPSSFRVVASVMRHRFSSYPGGYSGCSAVGSSQNHGGALTDLNPGIKILEDNLILNIVGRNSTP